MLVERIEDILPARIIKRRWVRDPLATDHDGFLFLRGALRGGTGDFLSVVADVVDEVNYIVAESRAEGQQGVDGGGDGFAEAGFLGHAV